MDCRHTSPILSSITSGTYNCVLRARKFRTGYIFAYFIVFKLRIKCGQKKNFKCFFIYAISIISCYWSCWAKPQEPDFDFWELEKMWIFFFFNFLFVQISRSLINVKSSMDCLEFRLKSLYASKCSKVEYNMISKPFQY